MAIANSSVEYTVSTQDTSEGHFVCYDSFNCRSFYVLIIVRTNNKSLIRTNKEGREGEIRGGDKYLVNLNDVN